jgi:hypothetical protein
MAADLFAPVPFLSTCTAAYDPAQSSGSDKELEL